MAGPLFLTLLCVTLLLAWLVMRFAADDAPLLDPVGLLQRALQGLPPIGLPGGESWPWSTSNEQQSTVPPHARKLGGTALCCVHTIESQLTGFKD